MRQALMLIPLVLVGVVLAGVVLGYVVRHPDPGMRARFLRLTGFWLVAAVAGFFGLFVVGEMVTDPGGWTAVWLIAAFVVPLAFCCLLAWRRPDAGTWLLAVLTAALLAVDVWSAIDPGALRDLENRMGPVQAIAVLGVGAAVGVLGLTRTRAAGIMLVLLGAGAWLSVGGVGGAAALAIVSGPLLLGGVLYLVSAAVAGGARPDGPAPDGSGGEGVEDRADVVGEAPGSQSEAR